MSALKSTNCFTSRRFPFRTMNFFVVFLFICQVICSQATISDGHIKLVEVESAPSGSLRGIVESHSADVLLYKNGTTTLLVNDVLLSNVTNDLISCGLSYNVVADDVIDELVKAEAAYMASKKSRRKREVRKMDWTTYHTLEDIEGYLSWLISAHGSLVKIVSAARTDEGRNVYVVRVSDESSKLPKKKIWIEGGIHAREWISPAVTTFLLHQVVTSPEFRPFLRTTEWYFVPVANPDGYSYSFSGGTRARLWRKNRKMNRGFTLDPCKGVDLNRNWDLKWGVGASSNPCAETYKGTQPFSEPETRGLSNVMKKVGPLDFFITFHSYGQSVLHPWGWTKKPPKNAKNLLKVGRKFVDAVNEVSRGKTKYSLGGSAEQYGFASGASDDWAFGALQTPYSYTIELRDKGKYGFMLPETQIFDTVKESTVGAYCMISYFTNIGLCSQRRQNSFVQPRANSGINREKIVFRD